MQSSKQKIIPSIGTEMGGGYYAGRVMIKGQPFALIVAPKGEGEAIDRAWFDSYNAVEGAKSFDDGEANTRAMAEAGSDLAKWVLGLAIGGNADWYLPSQDELEVVYRNLKPTTQENSQYGRSGINLSAMPPTRPYNTMFPSQTFAEAFQLGGEQAFEEQPYWTSTQHAGYSADAWDQTFNDGTQYYWDKDFKLCARAVRKLPI